MRILEATFLAATCLFVSGCTTAPKSTTGSATLVPATQIKSPVAQQAMGVGAVPVNVELGQQLKVPAIYRISAEGEFTEICSKDFELQSALQAIVVEERKSTDVIYDKLAGGRATFNFFGLGSFQLPYTKTKVDGYTVRTALTPTADNVVDYILANLGPNCPATTLSKAPYFVVTGSAVADAAYTVSREAISGSIPLASWGSLDYTNDENIEGPRTKVTFGVKGRWIKPETAPQG